MKILFTFLFISITVYSQSRIHFNNKDIFLSGSNVAWVNFARDVGPDFTDFKEFGSIFSTLNSNGGNAMRLWLHTNGVSSPQFSLSRVTGPGSSTISDIKRILDSAWTNNVGLVLCLWSFDMLRISFGENLTTRAKLMLTDTSYTNAYIKNCLIPMVNELKNHPAIIAWEIFNEPEGMSNEFGWDFNYHVPMSNIQRFINLCVAAIHRADPDAQVTNGSWSFLAATDITTPGLAKQSETSLQSLTVEEKLTLQENFNQRYATELTADEIINQIEKIYSVNGKNTNYYRDDRLIAAGKDSLGTLDFYTVHYYDWAGTTLSPFDHPCSYWLLDKPLAVAEFFPNKSYRMYERLYSTGYAGALTWSWTDDANGSTKIKTKTEMNYMVQNYPDDIHVNHGDWLVPPSTYLLHQNYPNPFNNETHIQYWLPERTTVRLEVYDMLGKRVAVLVNEDQDAAKHTIIFNGNHLASGLYLCRLRTNKFDQTVTMLLLK